MRKIIFVIAALLLVSILMTGCASDAYKEYTEVNKINYGSASTFAVLYRGFNYAIVYDVETKVMYMFNRYMLTPLLNADGSLKLWKGETYDKR